MTVGVFSPLITLNFTRYRHAFGSASLPIRTSISMCGGLRAFKHLRAENPKRLSTAACSPPEPGRARSERKRNASSRFDLPDAFGPTKKARLNNEISTSRKLRQFVRTSRVNRSDFPGILAKQISIRSSVAQMDSYITLLYIKDVCRNSASKHLRYGTGIQSARRNRSSPLHRRTVMKAPIIDRPAAMQAEIRSRRSAISVRSRSLPAEGR